MGQQSSKSTAEDRSVLHHVDDEDRLENPVFHSQKWKTHGLHPSPRTREASGVYPRPRSRSDAGGLVYVMDNPTGGVWVKPEHKWTRS